MIPALKTLRALAGYLLCATFILNTPTGVFNFMGWFFLAMALLALFRIRYAWTVWYAIDVLICSVCHATYNRTISGYTGERMDRYKRYALQARVIDALARVFGDEPDHCYRTYLWEKSKGLA